MKKLMMQKDDTIYEQVVEGQTILVSRHHCRHLYDIYGDLEFMLHKTKVSIKPQGYLYSYLNQKDCFIGIQSIPDSFNQYRLGTIFLRNFYVGFDYYKDEIVIGLNKGIVHASIEGKSEDPVIKREKTGAIVFIMCFFTVTTIVALCFFHKAMDREKEQKVVFAAPDKKRYRNGVEIKPNTGLNESTEEFLDS
jgi:hypothetical protein